MVTDSTTDPKPAAPARHVWQLPTFLLGLLALYAAYKYVPPRGAPAGPATAGELAELKSALDQRTVDAAAVEPLVRKLAATSPTDTPTNFALGSGYAALAELSGDADHWQAAATAFRKCDATQFESPADVAKWTYRSALAKAAVRDGDPAELIRAMATPPAGEDRPERLRLIAETALRLTPPDAALAKQHLAKYLGGQNRATPATAAKCKLELAKLHLKDREFDKARTWLKDIGAAAPADVQARAKVQLGHVAMAERKWADAVASFEDALRKDLPADERGAIRYQAAVALMQSGNDAAAVPYLRQTVKEPGDLGAAAAMRLAEVSNRDPAAKDSRTETAELLAKAVAQASATSEHVKAPELRALFEEVIKASTTEGNFPAAQQAATAYAKIAEGDADRKLRAEINERWAAALLKTNPADAKPKFLDAAAEYAALGERAADGSQRADFYRKAALQFRQAGETTKALDLVTAVLTDKAVPNDLVGRAWMDRADLLPPGQTEEIEEALKKAVNYAGPAQNAARYKLAVTYVKRGQDAAAGEAGKQQAKLGRDMLAQIADAATVAPADQFTHEQALFELGRLAMLDRQYPDAETRLRKQLTLYPQGTHADNARLWLASALLARAQADATVAAKARTEALVYLKDLAKSPDKFLQTWGEIWQANTLLQMGDTAATIALCKELTAKHAGKLEELVLGKLLFHAYLTTDPGEALKTLTRMEELFAKLPRDAFRTDAEYSYEHFKAELPRLREMLAKR